MACFQFLLKDYKENIKELDILCDADLIHLISICNITETLPHHAGVYCQCTFNKL